MNGFLHLHQFAGWINTTAPHTWARSITVATQDRGLLAVQITHVLTVCAVIGTAGIFSLRMMGLVSGHQPIGLLARRLLPWAWVAIVAQILTGMFMIFDRPERAFDSLTFPYKMILLVVAIIVTAVFSLTLWSDPQYWEKNPGRRAQARWLGALSLLLWVGVIFAGRWIAYERVPV